MLKRLEANHGKTVEKPLASMVDSDPWLFLSPRRISQRAKAKPMTQEKIRQPSDEYTTSASFKGVFCVKVCESVKKLL